MAPQLDPRIHVLKSYCSKDGNIPLSQSNYEWGWTCPQISMHAYAPYGLIVSKPWWVSHSQPWFSHSHCAHFITKGSHMLSIVDTWGRIQHFFKSCFAIVTIGCCSVSLTRMHWHLVPQKIKQSYTENYDALDTTSTRWGNLFSNEGFVPNCTMTACLIATDDVYVGYRTDKFMLPVTPLTVPVRVFLPSLLVT